MKNLIFLALLSLLLYACEEQSINAPGALVPLTVDEDTTLPSIFVNGTLLHSKAYGDPENPMIIAIHGGPGADYRSILNLRHFAADSFYVVFYDQRGSGLSRRHDADIYSTQLFINDLDAVIEHYRQSEDQKVILMGHSWGAMLATAYINKYPGRVTGAVLMEPGGFTWDDTKDYIERSQNIELFSEATNDVVYQDQFLTGHDHNILDYKGGLSSIDYAEGNKIGNPGPYPSWRFGAVCQKASFDYVEEHPFDFTTSLDQYSTKVLFAYSELSEAYGENSCRNSLLRFS